MPVFLVNESSRDRETNSKSRSLKASNEAQEPCAVKVARTVPRGGKCRKAPTYPDFDEAPLCVVVVTMESAAIVGQ